MRNTTFHYPTINFLRGIAALMVCVFHFLHFKTLHHSVLTENGFWWNISEWGSLGVFIFFVISGFVIPLSLHKYNFEFIQTGRFIARRAIRIELPYIASIGLILALQLIFYLHSQQEITYSIKQLIEHIFYLIPFTKDPWLNPIYWTLAIEFQFYLLSVILYILLKRTSSNKKPLILILFLATYFLFPDSRFVSAYAPFFLVGICTYLHKTEQLSFERFLLYVSILLAIILFRYGTMEGICVMLTLLCIHFLVICNRFTEWFGKISYSLYLVHGATGGTFLYFILEKTHTTMEILLCLFLAVIISVLSAWIFWRLIESPSIRLSKKIKL